ncbi:MAG: hypothetical protein JWN08_3236 [Frankiales bacterium]|nr:hypothetical protein [Frankiales bacterium]
MSSTRTRASRPIGADPTSTALLLAGPTAVELWPGLRRLGEVGGRVLVELDRPTPTAASVTARPPRRTPTAYVTRFGWTGPDLPVTEGVLTLTYAPGDATPSTRAELVLDSEDVALSRLDEAALAQMAEQFLANLARAAESRRAA